MSIAEKHTCFSKEFLNVQVQAYCGLDCEQLKKETAEKSLRYAVTHMNERFRVVIVAEQLSSSIKLLEMVVPDFFSGLNAKAAATLRMFDSISATPPPTPSPTPRPVPTSAPTPKVFPVTYCPDNGAFCHCDGTMYYGKMYVSGLKYQAGGSGPRCTLEELKANPYSSKDVVRHIVF